MIETLGQLRARIRRESEEALALLAEFGLHGKWSTDHREIGHHHA